MAQGDDATRTEATEVEDLKLDDLQLDDLQLEAIGEIGALLDAAGIAHWLFGGWGVDFLVGRRTRPHSDVDLAVRRRDRPLVHERLQSSGWEHTPLPDEVVGTRYARRAVRLELTFVVDGQAGEVLIPFEPEAMQWSAAPFGDEISVLEGVRARTVPLRQMLTDKARPREDAEDGEKDRSDLAALQAAVPPE